MTQPLTADLPQARTRPIGDTEPDLRASSTATVLPDPESETLSETGPLGGAESGTESRSKLLDLSLTQLLGGSMAAATAAALGSRLGVVGTIAGAAVLSVVSAIAGTIYTNSMARAREVVVLVRSRRDVALGRPGLTLPARVRQGWTRPDRATARRALATTGAVFALAAAFLAGLQLATGAPVTGTNLGGRTAAGVVVDGSADSAGGAAGSRKTDAVGRGSANSSGTTAGDAHGTGVDSPTSTTVSGTPTTAVADTPPSVATTPEPPQATQPASGVTTPVSPAAGDPTGSSTGAAAGAPTPGSTPTP
ncbi:hypothetical protein [Terrabacter sp. 2RAF25]|uniref:hypothetical protein n=1 Tax=Terrabacter sp. 2RAF25 TaxID=3232998 RepID=UPI003F97C100